MRYCLGIHGWVLSVVVGGMMAFSFTAFAGYGDSGELRQEGPTHGAEASSGYNVPVGACFLSATGVFKIMTETGEDLPVVKLERAREKSSGCPQKLVYTEIEAAYTELETADVQYANNNCIGISDRAAYDSCVFNNFMADSRQPLVPNVRPVESIVYDYMKEVRIWNACFELANNSPEEGGDCNGGLDDRECFEHYGCGNHMEILDERST